MKIAINNCHGGFGLSKEAQEMLAVLSMHCDKHNKVQTAQDTVEFRSYPPLIKVIEKLGEKASGAFSSIKIIEVPDDVKVHIAEYDGFEWIAENHRTWH